MNSSAYGFCYSPDCFLVPQIQPQPLWLLSAPSISRLPALFLALCADIVVAHACRQCHTASHLHCDLTEGIHAHLDIRQLHASLQDVPQLLSCESRLGSHRLQVSKVDTYLICLDPYAGIVVHNSLNRHKEFHTIKDQQIKLHYPTRLLPMLVRMQVDDSLADMLLIVRALHSVYDCHTCFRCV